MRGKRGALALVGLVLGSGLPAAAHAEDCAPPFLPVAESRPSQVPAAGFPDEGSIDHLRSVHEGSPDTDGDGRDDVVLEQQDLDRWQFTVRRGDGDVTFALPGPRTFVFRNDGAWWGDLDADGRDDLLVRRRTETEDELYAVPGTVAPGSHDPAAVGVHLTGGSLPVHAWGWHHVGDQTGDGTRDLQGVDHLLSGPAVLAAGPGGVLDEAGSTVDRGAGRYGGLLVLDGGPPVPVAIRRAGEAVELDVRGTVLRTGAVTALPHETLSVTGFRSGGHRIVVLDAGARGSTARWLWDLDDPCRARTHVVRRGEWLWSIARTYAPADVARYVATLYERNRATIGPDPDRLRPGTVLVLP